MESELKPCPFCGGIAAALDIRFVCENCGASTPRYGSPETAARKWNNRALDERDAEIERLTKRLEVASDPRHVILCGSCGAVNEIPCELELTIARLRAVLEWAIETTDTSVATFPPRVHVWPTTVVYTVAHALRGDWPAVRAAGVVLPGEE